MSNEKRMPTLVEMQSGAEALVREISRLPRSDVQRVARKMVQRLRPSVVRAWKDHAAQEQPR